MVDSFLGAFNVSYVPFDSKGTIGSLGISAVWLMFLSSAPSNMAVCINKVVITSKIWSPNTTVFFRVIVILDTIIMNASFPLSDDSLLWSGAFNFSALEPEQVDETNACQEIFQREYYCSWDINYI